MGNLLGAPITDKETHCGVVIPGEIEYGVSAMQGWRTHMEDAHITESSLYAVESTTTPKSKRIISLPGHSLFAVFDGHGGAFAARFAGRNACRVLSKEPKFVQYAKSVQERLLREQQQQQQQQKPQQQQQQQQPPQHVDPQKEAQLLRTELNLLEGALRDAFVELDREIAMAQLGQKHPDADTPYSLQELENSESQNSQSSKTASKPLLERSSRDPANHSQILEDPDEDSGTTACVVVLTPNWIVCSNAGDSRAVSSKNGNRAVPLSYDHKPDDDEEERRIRAAGGYVAGGRVEGDLAVSRGLGDFRFKSMETVCAGIHGSGNDGDNNNNNNNNGNTTNDNNDPGNDQDDDYRTYDTNNRVIMAPGDQKVSPVPDIIVQTRNPDQDEFMIIACDGIWDVKSNQQCVDTIAQLFSEGETDLGLICEELLDECLRFGSKDNMSAVIVKFQAQKSAAGGSGVKGRRKRREDEMKEDLEQRQRQDDGEDDEDTYGGTTTETTTPPVPPSSGGGGEEEEKVP